MSTGPLTRSRTRRSIAVLATLAYLPVLLSHPGRLPADTKLGLTLDPARLLTDSVRSWDVSQFAGWVPHQSISYLWPSGPFYWLMLELGLSEWVVQRLAVGCLFLAGGAGVRWFVRRRGYSVSAALIAAMVYQLSPYVLPYASRTSLMLLPWAGLGWLMGLADQAAESGARRWRATALFGLVIASVGGLNLTATAMIAPAPLLLLLHRGMRRETPWSTVMTTAIRLLGVSLACSAWWLSMLAVQGRHGADVLGYSETLEAVSATSSTPEVLRGMGYWLAYIHAPSGTTTSAATPYMTSPWLIAAGFTLLVGSLAALALGRFRERMLVASLLFVGVVLAVGVHPISDPSPLMSAIADDSRSTLALAMRSSTRAVPLIVLACAIGAAALVDATALVRSRSRALVAPLFAVLAVVNQPALFTGNLADPQLLHDPRPPAGWYRSAASLDRGDLEARVLQLPGVESQVFSWGYTVDPPLAWLTDKPMITRDWLPLGTPAAMDLLFAFDDRFQAGTAEARAIAPVMRLLAADTVWLAVDADSDRFASASATEIEGLLAQVGELSRLEENDHVVLFGLDDPQQITRTTSTTVVLFGSGDGVVDASAAGVLDGSEALLYAADLTDEELAAWAADGAFFIVTDSNRDRARQWRGSQDVWGFTETGGLTADVLRFDPQDARLPLFVDQAARDQTVATLAEFAVRATSYGSAVRYLPQYRPAMAVDGDASTAWVVGVDSGPRVGEMLRVESVGEGGLLLRQPAGAARITRIRVAGKDPTDRVSDVSIVVEIDPSDRAAVPVAIAGTVTITIETVEGDGPVGFSELLEGSVDEVVRVPLLRVELPGTTPFAAVFTRLRVDDQETVMRREFQTPAIDRPAWAVEVRGRAGASCRDDLIEIDGRSLPLLVTEANSAALSRGEVVTLEPCSAVGALAPGEHRLVGASSSGLDIDRVVLRSSVVPPSRTGTVVPSASIDRGSTDHTVTVRDCPVGCWLIFGEGFTSGWRATSADAELGRHLPVAGGFNGWWITPTEGGQATVHLHWSGQHPIWIALAFSAASAATLAVIAVWPQRRAKRRSPRRPSWPVRSPESPRLCHPLQASPRRVVALSAVGAAVAIAMFVDPSYSLVCLPLLTVAVLGRRPRLVALAALLTILAGGAAISGAVLLRDLQPSFAWPSSFARLHKPLLVALVLLVAFSAAVDEEAA